MQAVTLHVQGMYHIAGNFRKVQIFERVPRVRKFFFASHVCALRTCIGRFDSLRLVFEDGHSLIFYEASSWSSKFVRASVKLALSYFCTRGLRKFKFQIFFSKPDFNFMWKFAPSKISHYTICMYVCMEERREGRRNRERGESEIEMRIPNTDCSCRHNNFIAA